MRLTREVMQANHSLLTIMPTISASYSRRKSRAEGGLRASCGSLKLRPLLQTGLSGAEANLPEASSYVLSAQLPRLAQERGFQTETC